MLKGLINAAGPIGIDLSDDAARLLQLSSSQGALRVIASARVDLAPLNIDHDPNDPAPDELVRAIARRVQAGGFVGKRCLITLPDRSLSLRTARLPAMSDAELANAVALDAPAHLGLEGTEGGAEIGWVRTGDIFQGEERRYELMYFGVSTTRLEQLAFAFEGAGLEPVALEPRFVALTRAATRFLRRTADSDTVQLVIDICEQQTAILITRGAGLVFAKHIPIGAHQMNEAIEKRLGLDGATVAELRRQRMRAADEDEIEERVERAMFDAVRPTLASIAHEASLCLRHYSVTYRGARPVRVLLSGSAAREPGMGRVLTEALGIEASPYEPLEGVRTDTVVGGGRYEGDWTGAIGIAARDLLRRPASRNRNQRRSKPAPQTEGRAA